MIEPKLTFNNELNSNFKVFHELMSYKVKNILLISTPYDAWVMENDCRLSEQIINEYRGLNLSHPPKLTWVSSSKQAIKILKKKIFDIIIKIPTLSEFKNKNIGKIIKKNFPKIPLILLLHNTLLPFQNHNKNIWYNSNMILIWSGNTDLLIALIKSTEDAMNVDQDTTSAGVRVIIFIEDTPFYISSLLPIFYKELVIQTQAVMESTLNEEHRLLTMKARPKILVAKNYNEAILLYKKFEPYILGIVSDVSFNKNNIIHNKAGIELLKYISKKKFDIPLLLTSSNPNNKKQAKKIPATFVDKNSETLHQDVRHFFKKQLGFGNFIFRMPDGNKLGYATNLQSLEKELLKIPKKSFLYHCQRNDFSRWLFARTEIILASKIRLFKYDYFEDMGRHRKYLASIIRNRIKKRQKGIIADFNNSDFKSDFLKIGKGSLGGKARGLAFISSILSNDNNLELKYKNINFIIPKTLVITTDGFKSFIEKNNLKYIAKSNISDKKIAKFFLESKLPYWLKKKLKFYIKKVNYPLAIRSSSLLEDAQFSAYAGLYKTYMVSNDHCDTKKRLEHLIKAIKLIYASTYFKNPKSFSKGIGNRIEEEQMAIIIQKLVGNKYKNYFYPAISGIIQSYNYYPYAKMKPEEGITSIVMGLGKMITEGGKNLRFSPVYPQVLPQLSNVEDTLKNTQKMFYSLKMEKKCHPLLINDDANLFKREINEAKNEFPMKILSSTYIPSEHRIRNINQVNGYPILTFTNILRGNYIPLSEIIQDIMKIGQEKMGCAVELEFSINLNNDSKTKPEFAFLQLRPMAARAKLADVYITNEERKKSFCFSDKALGNTKKQNIIDIVYVKPDKFDNTKTKLIANDINKINKILTNKNRKYLLIGPGRWGSRDSYLGIPVTWQNISGVGAIIENISDTLRPEPSQGSHFFHNITTRHINYITISKKKQNFLDWKWLISKPIAYNTKFIAHVKLKHPMTIKVDGKTSNCVILVK